MKDIVIVLLLVAIVILVFGAVNQDQQIDFDYIAGTWESVSVFALAAIGAGVTLLVGLGAAAAARQRVVGDRHKLERELEQVYKRLRAAEQTARLQTGSAGEEPRAAATGEVAVAVPATATVEAEGEVSAAAAAEPEADSTSREDTPA